MVWLWFLSLYIKEHRKLRKSNSSPLIMAQIKLKNFMVAISKKQYTLGKNHASNPKLKSKSSQEDESHEQAIAFTVMLVIISGAPLLTCDCWRWWPRRGQSRQIPGDIERPQKLPVCWKCVKNGRSVPVVSGNEHLQCPRYFSKKSVGATWKCSVGLQGTLSNQALVLVSSVTYATCYCYHIIWLYDGRHVNEYCIIGVYEQQSRVNHTRLPSRTRAY